MWHIVLETLNASEQVLLDVCGEQFRVFMRVFRILSRAAAVYQFVCLFVCLYLFLVEDIPLCDRIERQ
jgi:hypothetical protein